METKGLSRKVQLYILSGKSSLLRTEKRETNQFNGLLHYNRPGSLFLPPVIPHMPHQGFPGAATRIQSILCRPQQLKAADFLVLQKQRKGHLVAGRNTTCQMCIFGFTSITLKRKGGIHTLSTYCGDVVCRERHKWWVERLILFVVVKNVRFTANEKWMTQLNIVPN